MGVEMTGGGTALPVNYEYSFIGIVCAYGKEPGTVIVRRPDKDDRTTKELRVLSRCTNKTKDWWMPDIDEQVICFLMPNTNGKGPGEGFVACAMYSKEDPPVETSNNVRSIHYKDGSFIRIDMDKGKIEIHASKELVLTAPKIRIEAEEKLEFEAPLIEMKGGKHIDLKAPRIDIN
jgi:phage baseplate assembly protein V